MVFFEFFTLCFCLNQFTYKWLVDAFLILSYVNELVEYIFLSVKDNANKEGCYDSSIGSSIRDASVHTELSQSNSQMKEAVIPSQQKDISIVVNRNQHSAIQVQSKPADWARKLDAVTQRRTQVLAPENLENLWSKGRNYKKKSGYQKSAVSSTNMKISESVNSESLSGDAISEDIMRGRVSTHVHVNEDRDVKGNVLLLKRSSSSPALENQSSGDTSVTTKTDGFVVPRNSQTSAADIFRDDVKVKSASDLVTHGDGSLFVPKLKCRVSDIFVYFEIAF